MLRLASVAIGRSGLARHSEVITLPNAFTPNGDGINDCWKPTYTDTLALIQVRISDRYGVLVCQTEDKYFWWIGTSINGRLMEQNTNVYSNQYMHERELFQLKGLVVLIRERHRLRGRKTQKE